MPLCNRKAAALMLALLSGCTAVTLNRDAARPHHTAQGFKNNYIDRVSKGFGELLRWQLERRIQGVPKPPLQPTATQPPDLAAIRNYASDSQKPPGPPQITWIGHATMLVQAGGLNVLTDPVFSERASPVQFLGPKRLHPPGVSLADLPPIDVVLISHNHYDHLDRASVQALAQRSGADGKPTLFLVPLGLKPWFGELGISHVTELDWWDKQQVRGVDFYLTPVQHWSARGVTDRNQSLWGGYAVIGSDFHWYFSGDTGYSKDFADTAARFAEQQTDKQGGGFDLALIAIGAYEPRWFMKEQHVNPEEAVKIHRDLHAKHSVGAHWGTFELTDEALDQPPKDLAAARKAQGVGEPEFNTMAIGETRQLPARPKP